MIELELPAGYSIDATQKLSGEVSHWLMQPDSNPEVADHVTYIGFGGPRFVLSLNPNDPAPHRAFMLVNLKDGSSQQAAMDKARNYLTGQFPEARISVKGFGSGGAEEGSIEYRIKGPDKITLRQISEQVQGLLYQQPGMINIQDNWDNKVFKLKVQIDQTKAELAGLSTEQVSRALDTLLSSGEITQFREGDQSIPVTVRSAGIEREDVERFGTLYVGNDREGNPITLTQIATFTRSQPSHSSAVTIWNRPLRLKASAACCRPAKWSAVWHRKSPRWAFRQATALKSVAKRSLPMMPPQHWPRTCQ